MRSMPPLTARVMSTPRWASWASWATRLGDKAGRRGLTGVPGGGNVAFMSTATRQSVTFSRPQAACTLDIIIVNWNAGPWLRGCLETIVTTARTGFVLERVVVVDNDSRDGSADGLESLPLPLTLIRNPENRGFAVACNQGAAGSRADVLLFLNPDTRLQEHSLTQPLAYLAAPGHADVGLVGIQLVDTDGTVSRCCARFPTPGRLLAQSLGLDRLLPRLFHPHFMVEWDHRSTRVVDQVIGAFLMIRRSAFQALEGFDERFFVYFDDVDLALRARRHGWATVFLADARAVHAGGGTTDRIKATRLFYGLRSRIQFAFKHFGRSGGWLVTGAALLAEPLARLGLALVRRSPVQAGEVLRGYAKLWGDLPRFLPPAARCAQKPGTLRPGTLRP